MYVPQTPLPHQLSQLHPPGYRHPSAGCGVGGSQRSGQDQHPRSHLFSRGVHLVSNPCGPPDRQFHRSKKQSADGYASRGGIPAGEEQTSSGSASDPRADGRGQQPAPAQGSSAGWREETCQRCDRSFQRGHLRPADVADRRRRAGRPPPLPQSGIGTVHACVCACVKRIQPGAYPAQRPPQVARRTRRKRRQAKQSRGPARGLG